MLVGVGMLVDGKVYSLPKPARHHQLFDHMLEQGVPAENVRRIPLKDQGFVTETGQFLRRNAAEMHARSCGQLASDYELLGSILTSEDLW